MTSQECGDLFGERAPAFRQKRRADHCKSNAVDPAPDPLGALLANIQFDGFPVKANVGDTEAAKQATSYHGEPPAGAGPKKPTCDQNKRDTAGQQRDSRRFVSHGTL